MIQLILYQYTSSNITISVRTTDYAKAKKIAESMYDSDTTEKVVVFIENTQVAVYLGYWTNNFEYEQERLYHEV